PGLLVIAVVYGWTFRRLEMEDRPDGDARRARVEEEISVVVVDRQDPISEADGDHVPRIHTEGAICLPGAARSARADIRASGKMDVGGRGPANASSSARVQPLLRG